RPTPSLEFVRYELEDVTAEELSRTLPTVYARGRQRPRRPVVGAGAGREGHGVGGRFDGGQGIRQRARPFPRRGLRLMDSSVSEAMSASGSHVHPVPTVGRAESVSRALEVFRSSDAQVVAVVDADGRLVGTILERELLRYLFRGRSS
ncbi:MAG: CBS domain-containing protein, partial [Nitrososphaeria archaeon]